MTKKVTIKDIAKYAGVSHGTVSNVLNHKGNVSTEKILLVEQAAKALGYQMNSQASGLRSGKSKNIPSRTEVRERIEPPQHLQ